VHSFSPDGSARTRHSVDPRRVGNSPNRKISVDCFAHIIPREIWFIYFGQLLSNYFAYESAPRKWSETYG
jgi:hypothetical protein